MSRLHTPKHLARSLVGFGLLIAACGPEPQDVREFGASQSHIGLDVGGFVENHLSSRCLDVSGSPGALDGANVQLWDCEREDFADGRPTDQRWQLNPDGFIVNLNSGKCLDVSGAPGTANGANVQLWACEFERPETDQRWRGTPEGFIENALSGKCLDVEGAPGTTNGANVQLGECERDGGAHSSTTDHRWNSPLETLASGFDLKTGVELQGTIVGSSEDEGLPPNLNTTFANCAVACFEADDCPGFVFNAVEQSCVFRNGTLRRARLCRGSPHCEGVVSGVKRTPFLQFAIETGIKIGGSAYRVHEDTTHTACAQACASSSICEGFTHWSAVNPWRCELFNEIEGNTSALGANSGFRGGYDDPIAGVGGLLVTSANVCPAPYTRIPALHSLNGDLNQGAGGKYIFLCQSRRPISEALSDVLISESSRCPAKLRRIEQRGGLNGDLNQGAGGKDIYLCEGAGGFSPYVDFLISESWFCPRGYQKVARVSSLNGDLNQGAGGKDIYLCGQRMTDRGDNDALSEATGGASFVIGSGYSIGRCLTIQEGKAALTDCGASGSQMFRYEPAARALLTEAGECLDGRGHELAVAACETSESQTWLLDVHGRLVNAPATTGLCLSSPNLDAGATPSLGDCAGVPRPGELWSFEGNHEVVDYAALTAGVESFQLPYDLAPMGAVKGTATPILMAESGEVVAVAGTFGSARAVGFGTWRGVGAFGTVAAGRTLLANAVRWAGNSNQPVIGLAPDARVHNTWATLTAMGFEVRNASLEALSDVDVLILGPGGDGYSAASLASLLAFVKEGRGLLAARNTFFSWDRWQHPLSENLTARIFSDFGVGWTQASRADVDKNAPLSVPNEPSLYNNATNAFEAVARDVLDIANLDNLGRDHIYNATELAVTAHVQLRPTSAFVRAQEAIKRVHGPLDIRLDAPFTFGTWLSDLALRGDYLRYSGVDGHRLPIHESTAAFPGTVAASAPRITRTVSITGTSTNGPKRWVSTGLYAAPGERIRFRIPETATGAELRARIGASFDIVMPKAGEHYKRRIYRFPKVYTTRLLFEPEVKFANPFGGLIYIAAPRGIDLGTIDLTIEGAVAAPRFILGQDDPAGFLADVENLGVPAGELQGEAIILTARSRYLREVTDPEAVVRFHDALVLAEASLVGATTDNAEGVETLPQRIVFDPWEDWGAHSGYPIHITESWASDILDLEGIRRGEGLWALVHEVGHNYQQDMWTFAGTREVTNNFIAVYAYETVTGLPKDGAWSENLLPEVRHARLQAYLESDVKYTKARFSVRLEAMLLLAESFGWPAFKEVFREYRALPVSERPHTNQDRIDGWVVRTSQKVNRNLAPYFERFRIPFSEEAKAQIVSLPAWTENPLLDYLASPVSAPR